MRTRAYLKSRRLVQQTTRFVDAVFGGFWLGWLDGDALHEIDAHFYESWKTYRDEDYNRSGLSPWEKQMLERYFGNCRSVLLGGAGGGREILPLIARGLRVEAFECHPELAAFANEMLADEGVDTRVSIVERDRCLETDELFDGLIVGWGAYMLIRPRETRIDFLRAFRARGVSGAPLLLSFFSRSPHSRRYRLSARVANVFRWLRRRQLVEVGDAMAPNYVHFFTEDQLRAEVAEAGFDLQYYSVKEYGHAVAIARES